MVVLRPAIRSVTTGHAPQCGHTPPGVQAKMLKTSQNKVPIVPSNKRSKARAGAYASHGSANAVSIGGQRHAPVQPPVQGTSTERRTFVSLVALLASPPVHCQHAPDFGDSRNISPDHHIQRLLYFPCPEAVRQDRPTSPWSAAPCRRQDIAQDSRTQTLPSSITADDICSSFAADSSGTRGRTASLLDRRRSLPGCLTSCGLTHLARRSPSTGESPARTSGIATRQQLFLVAKLN